jgi:uncharacterized protein
MIRDIIFEQKEELRKNFKEKYVERETQAFSLKHNLIKVIIGPRRAGKSFFVVHTLKNEKFGYANFDNEELAKTKEYDEIMSTISEIYEKPTTIFFDEIQNLPNWELFVNRLQRQGYNIIVTGSNSHLLSKELATHLTGRHLPTNILTFSFKEYLKAKEILPEKVTTRKIGELFHQYLQEGGYPETITKDIPTKQYLTILFDSIIYKDIVKRYNIRGKAIEQLGLFLISNAATEFSYLSLAKATQIKSSITTQKYTGYLEDAYLFFKITRFSYKTKKQDQNKKIYCYDNGIISAKAFQTSQNLGKLLENVIAIHLKRKEIENKIDFYYWKNQQNEEVDFVVKEGIKVKQLIQACFDPTKAETKKREIRSLIKAGKELKCKNLLVLTDHYEAEEKHDWFGQKATIKFKPAWKYLLENNF